MDRLTVLTNIVPCCPGAACWTRVFMLLIAVDSIVHWVYLCCWLR